MVPDQSGVSLSLPPETLRQQVKNFVKISEKSHFSPSASALRKVFIAEDLRSVQSISRDVPDKEAELWKVKFFLSLGGSFGGLVSLYP
jgi:hypothetical protein